MKPTKRQIKIVENFIKTETKKIMKEVQDKTNSLLKINIRYNKDGSCEIFSQGKEITLPTQQHVEWIKKNL